MSNITTESIDSLKCGFEETLKDILLLSETEPEYFKALLKYLLKSNNIRLKALGCINEIAAQKGTLTKEEINRITTNIIKI